LYEQASPRGFFESDEREYIDVKDRTNQAPIFIFLKEQIIGIIDNKSIFV
jgi:hypothetical protein